MDQFEFVYCDGYWRGCSVPGAFHLANTPWQIDLLGMKPSHNKKLGTRTPEFIFAKKHPCFRCVGFTTDELIRCGVPPSILDVVRHRKRLRQWRLLYRGIRYEVLWRVHCYKLNRKFNAKNGGTNEAN